MFTIYNYTLKKRIRKAFLTVSISLALAIVFNANAFSAATIISPLGKETPKTAINQEKRYEVFGFAPHWTINKLDNVDFGVLTTLAYFGIEVDSAGNFEEDAGFEVFKSKKATALFDKAHKNGTRVVLTLTQMKNPKIKGLMDNLTSQKKLIKNTVELVKDRGIDGVNVDFEYVGNPGENYRKKFTKFVDDLTREMHQKIPNSKVTVSVYASAVKDPKIYEIRQLADVSDGIFMMAYDFATKTSDHAIPTSPLYGHKEGKYWYDISTAVDDFLTQMPAEKLILGLPWYGYNYPVASPEVKASTQRGYYTSYWYKRRLYSRFVPGPSSLAQTYTLAKEAGNGSSKVLNGWDDLGKVGFKAYKEGNAWRMIFLEDEKSLRIKYGFAKENRLLGVGMWALGFDSGTNEMWNLLGEEFGRNQIARAQQ